MKNHFIPQFLLQVWAEGASDGKLQSFKVDCPSGEVTLRRFAPAGTGYKDDLTTLSVENLQGMKRHDVEERFCQVLDNEAARIRKKLLIKGGIADLSDLEASRWSQFMFSLYYRQPSKVESIKRLSANQLIGELDSGEQEFQQIRLKEKIEEATLLEFVKSTYPGIIENFGLTFLHELIGSSKANKKFMALKWGIYSFNNSKHELLLSDNPRLSAGPLEDGPCIVALPIAPQKAFLAFRGNDLEKSLWSITPTEFAVRLNASSVNQATSRVYARNKTPLRFIQNRLKLRN